ncbi:hypothetical protein A6R68_06696 [Neotoma lepida]|uniref:Anaphase-promoting complex subunit 4 WD40 domain-containing protein n=1 Tax=Neotoma lepida TaxID=56216 RepID=A0A1A6GET4_NEOLE|nr:hypothetical protein A6R68_06696 [Neotoma lepida]
MIGLLRGFLSASSATLLVLGGKRGVSGRCGNMTGSNEFKLNQPPEDGISSVKFSPNTSQFLLVSSWDTSVRLYDVPANSMRLKYQHTGAVLDCAFYKILSELMMPPSDVWNTVRK